MNAETSNPTILEQGAADYRLRRDYGTPEDDVADAQERVVQRIADQLEVNREVAELIQYIADGGSFLLAAAAHYERATGRRPSYDETTLIGRIRQIVSDVENAE